MTLGKFAYGGFALTVLLGGTLAAADDSHAQVGINLAMPSYFTAEIPWNDLFKLSEPLFFQDPTQPWGNGTATPLDADGYPTSLAAGNQAWSLWDAPGGFSGGQYVVLYDGTGKLDVGFGGQEVSNTPGEVTFNIAAGSGQLLTKIVQTDPSNPVHDIRIVPASMAAAYTGGTPSNPWDQNFLQRWSGMSSFRYMDWMQTNNSPITSWSQRTTPTSQTQTNTPGVALEEMINLANTEHVNPWFNIPAQADNNYVQQFATMVKKQLDPSLTARIEYSNEVWNDQFQQAQYANAQGAAMNLPGTSFDKQLEFYSQRSVQIFNIFQNVFTDGGTDPQGMDRIKRIMAAQAANPYTSNLELSYDNAYQHVDALAVAPYFGNAITTQADATFFKTATHQQLLAREQQDVQDAIQVMGNQKIVADQYGVDLFAYEGGEGYVGADGFENDDALTAALQALNDSPDMRDLYSEYLKGWDSIGGKDFMLYDSVTAPGKFGDWGLYDSIDQDPATDYKLLGVMDYLNSVPEPGFPLAAILPILLRRRRARVSSATR